MSIYNNPMLQPSNDQWPMAQPGDSVSYVLDWSTYLKGVSGVVSASSWALPVISGAPTNPGSVSGITAGGTATFLKVTGGQPGVIYTFVNTITDSLGNVKSRTVDLPVAPV